ncbi:hypothetical protein OY671_012940, partial [Metschnikowia pulcherrima]
RDPRGSRRNTRDNTPAVSHVESVEGDGSESTVVAKGGGGDVKARYAMLNPSDSVADWVVAQSPGMGAGWCPPGVSGSGVGASRNAAIPETRFGVCRMQLQSQREGAVATVRLNRPEVRNAFQADTITESTGV